MIVNILERHTTKMLYIEERGNTRTFLRKVGECRLDNKMLDTKDRCVNQLAT
jgi:hypothetical protein